MATKRAHTKSRKGCIPCKRRHIKCNESRPCANCVVRGSDCHYAPSASDSNSQEKPKLLTESWGLQACQFKLTTVLEHPHGLSMRSSFQSNRLRELELMQHWCTKTCYSFTTHNADTFRDSVVQEALKHDYLMDAILAFTSLHIASGMSDPAAVASYTIPALQYHSKAISALHTRLQHLAPSEWGAIFTCSILTMACTITIPLLPNKDDGQTKSSTESVLHLFDFIKGIASVVELGYEWLENSPFRTIMHAPLDPFPLQENERDALVKRLKHSNNLLHCGPLSFQHRIYQDIIEELEAFFPTNRFKLITWLYQAGEDIRDGLRTRDPVALMIFVHWGALLSQLEELWWAESLGRRLVVELSGELAQHGAVWDEAAAWLESWVGLETNMNKKTGEQHIPTIISDLSENPWL